jgi:hypothetical protein
VRTLDFDEAPQSVPQFHEQTFLFGAFCLVRFWHRIGRASAAKQPLFPRTCGSVQQTPAKASLLLAARTDHPPFWGGVRIFWVCVLTLRRRYTETETGANRARKRWAHQAAE